MVRNWWCLKDVLILLVLDDPEPPDGPNAAKSKYSVFKSAREKEKLC